MFKLQFKTTSAMGTIYFSKVGAKYRAGFEVAISFFSYYLECF